VLGGLGDIQGAGQIQAESLQIFQILAAREGTVHKSQAVDVKISQDVGIADLLGEDAVQRVFPFDPLGQDQIRPFRPVRDVGVFLVAMEDELIDVIEGKAEAGVHPPGLLQPPFH